ncbi:hypothetical protein VTK26DRAFT_1899 [Humicola hyalothermophila]
MRAISTATDILARLANPQDNDDDPTPPRRYAAYVRARHRFWEAFPGGRYARVPTPGADLECGLYAVRLSMAHQCRRLGESGGGGGVGSGNGNESSQEPVRGRAEGYGGERRQLGMEGKGGGAKVRIPELAELRAVARDVMSEMMGVDGGGGDVADEVKRMMGSEHGGWFTADQLAAVFAEWGRREGVKCQLGYVSEDIGGLPVMMSTKDVDTDDVGEDIVRVWVWNDGASMTGGVGHFEGLRRPTEEELARIGEPSG